MYFLFTIDGGVREITKNGLKVASGKEYELEVIIYATGFDAGLIPFEVIGKNKTSLSAKFGASKDNNYQMINPETLWGAACSRDAKFLHDGWTTKLKSCDERNTFVRRARKIYCKFGFSNEDRR